MKSGFWKTLLLVLKLCAIGLIIGVLGGGAGAVFSHLLAFVTDLRETARWIILLLPVGAVVTALLYSVFDMKTYGSANEIITRLKNKDNIRPAAAPLIFVSTAITHLLGGSAGREGAALQLGGAGASAVSNLLRLKDEERSVTIMAGMSAVFAGLFGTPLTAAFFVLEFKIGKRIVPLSILPCFISAIIAKKIALLMGAAGEKADLHYDFSFSFAAALKVCALAIALSIVGAVLCFAFKKTRFWAKKLIANQYIRALVGAVLVIILTVLVGDMRYSGSGMSMAIGAVEGKADWYDFILKIVFTSVTLAAGFKGGEIVPTFCVGATFGCVFGGIIGLNLGLAAALGLVGLFCCATRSPIGALALSFEMFGVSVLPYALILCVILWLLPSGSTLFENRTFVSPIAFCCRKTESNI